MKTIILNKRKPKLPDQEKEGQEESGLQGAEG